MAVYRGSPVELDREITEAWAGDVFHFLLTRGCHATVTIERRERGGLCARFPNGGGWHFDGCRGQFHGIVRRLMRWADQPDHCVNPGAEFGSVTRKEN